MSVSSGTSESSASTTSSNSSSSSTSTVSRSDEQLVRPPIAPVGEGKSLVVLDDENIDRKLVKEWMNGLGKLAGELELGENVSRLHGHLLPAIEALKQILKYSSEDLNVEVKKLIGYYSTLARICELMMERMEKSENILEFQKTKNSPSDHKVGAATKKQKG